MTEEEKSEQQREVFFDYLVYEKMINEQQQEMYNED